MYKLHCVLVTAENHESWEIHGDEYEQMEAAFVKNVKSTKLSQRTFSNHVKSKFSPTVQFYFIITYIKK